MTRYSDYQKKRMLLLHKKGLSVRQIAKTIAKEDNRNVSGKGVLNFLRKVKQFGTTKTLLGTGRKAILTPRKLSFIKNKILYDRTVSANELKKDIERNFEISVGETTINNARRKMGFYQQSSTRYGHSVREKNKEARLYFVHKLMTADPPMNFDDVIFTDEVSVSLNDKSRQRKPYRFKKEPIQKIHVPKHSFKVHVWAGISAEGATPSFTFTGIMDSSKYQDILNRCLIPFIKNKYPKSHKLWQDNDPKHESKSTKMFLSLNNINHFRTPAESPDLNPIELLWSNMKAHIQNGPKPKNKMELILAIRKYWKSVTKEECQRHIKHLKTVIPQVYINNGGPSGH